MDYQAIIQKYYRPGTPLYRILTVHSRMVANKALACAHKHPELKLDLVFIEEAAMLHDIGIFQTHAPGICCEGTHPYIMHGYLGAELMRAEGYPRHARVCERHTGAGITKTQIVEAGLPLPQQDFLPETLEEQLICYADKFYSKSHLEREKTAEKVVKSLQKFGNEGVERFLAWQKLFE